jgi:hypothetical protein
MKKTCKTDTCKWEGVNIGTHHIKCCHPSLGEMNDNPIGDLIGLLVTGHRGSGGILQNTPELNIIAEASSIRNGYFTFPFNFDKIWLLNCDGWEKPDIKNEEK